MAEPALARVHHATGAYGGFDRMPLGGAWRQGRSGKVGEDRDPYTNEILATIPLADERDLDEAFRAAAAAQPKWHAMLPGEKSAVIRRAAEITGERRAEMVEGRARVPGRSRDQGNAAGGVRPQVSAALWGF